MYAATYESGVPERPWARRALFLVAALTVTGAVLTAFSPSRRARGR